jgi:hypothetical protein
MKETATVKIFLAEGDPASIRTAEISNWTGKAVAGPRSQIEEIIQREEASKPGVYFLRLVCFVLITLMAVRHIVFRPWLTLRLRPGTGSPENMSDGTIARFRGGCSIRLFARGWCCGRSHMFAGKRWWIWGACSLTVAQGVQMVR